MMIMPGCINTRAPALRLPIRHLMMLMVRFSFIPLVKRTSMAIFSLIATPLISMLSSSALRPVSRMFSPRSKAFMLTLQICPLPMLRCLMLLSMVSLSLIRFRLRLSSALVTALVSG